MKIGKWNLRNFTIFINLQDALMNLDSIFVSTQKFYMIVLYLLNQMVFSKS